MNHRAFEGPAGTGKTYRLTEALLEHLEARHLQPHQKVLALTYMHGSCRRLNARLREKPALRNRYIVETIDAFAFALVRRWRTLAGQLGMTLPDAKDFEATRRVAARLLQDECVYRWVAMHTPIIVVDEFQDASPLHLALVQALANHVTLFMAADEFQCLDSRLLPSQAVAWMQAAFPIESLSSVRRTETQALLDAAVRLREGRPIISGTGFSIIPVPNAKQMAHRIGLELMKREGSTAIITPTQDGTFNKAIKKLTENDFSKETPFKAYRIRTERTAEKIAFDLASSVTGRGVTTPDELAQALSTSDDLYEQKFATLLARKAAITHLPIMTAELAKQLADQVVRNSRRLASPNERGITALTVHGAKNREFDGVIVYWPYATKGTDDQKRRLLYNAITRAKKWCSIVVANKKLLDAAPFC